MWDGSGHGLLGLILKLELARNAFLGINVRPHSQIHRLVNLPAFTKGVQVPALNNGAHRWNLEVDWNRDVARVSDSVPIEQ